MPTPRGRRAAPNRLDEPPPRAPPRPREAPPRRSEPRPGPRRDGRPAELRRRLGYTSSSRSTWDASAGSCSSRRVSTSPCKEAGSPNLAEEAETKRRAFLLKPDILVRKGRSPRVVADTKWKRLDPRSADLGVSGEDVYQVLAYAHRYATDTAVLIYPRHATVGRPGLQRDFAVQAGGGSRVVVRIATLDFARLERVAGEVGAAVGAVP